MSDIVSLQKKLGYKFIDSSLLVRALSHRSVGSPNNERLEYLGDSILGFVVAEILYHKFPRNSEGDLTKMRATLVRKTTLADLARNLRLQENMLMGGGELKSGGYNRDSILSDAIEAIVGAVYLDGGMKAVHIVLDPLYAEMLSSIQPVGLKDSKTQLQEMLQKKDLPLPAYSVINQQGEAHNLVFTVSCEVTGISTKFVSSASSRKHAEQGAAALALEAMASHELEG